MSDQGTAAAAFVAGQLLALAARVVDGRPVYADELEEAAAVLIKTFKIDHPEARRALERVQARTGLAQDTKPKT